MKVGDIVRFTDQNDGNIPYKAIGEVKEVDDWSVDVEFNGIHHRNPYKQSNVWSCCIENLKVMHEAPESSEKRLHHTTLTIPLVRGIESLTGEFMDSEGNAYDVQVLKIDEILCEEV